MFIELMIFTDLMMIIELKDVNQHAEYKHEVE